MALAARFELTLVSRFRSSPYFDIALRANFEIKTTLGINRLLVSFDSEIRFVLDIELVRISESGHEPRTLVPFLQDGGTARTFTPLQESIREFPAKH